MKTIQITSDILVDFTAKFTLWGPDYCASVSLKYNTCCIYRKLYNPDGSFYVDHQAYNAVRESDVGLLFFNGNMWTLFNEEVQIAYSDFIAEKELLEK